MPSSIRYAGFYQPDLLRLLQQRKAALMPYHTETADGDPVNAQLVAEAFRGGVHNSLVDMGLSELNWATLRRRSSAVAVAASQGQRLSAAVPARIPVLARLSGLPTLPAVVVPAGSAWSSEGDGTNPPVVAEAAADITVDSVDLEVYCVAGAKTLHVGHRTLLFSGFAFSAAGYAVGLTFAPQFWTDAIRDSGAAGSWQSVSVGYQDGTEALTKAGTVQWSVPALFADAGSWWRRWAKTTVNGIEAYWVRLVGSGAGSGVTTPAGTPAQPWYVWFQALQGETVTDLLGTTDGSAWQKHRLKQSPLIEESILQVAFGDDLSWAEIDNPSLAGPAARVWWLVEDAQGYAIQTGDGVNGVVPPSGVAVEAEYRIGADVDGNVGVGTLVVNRSGTPRIAAVTNPAAGSGWEAAEGSTAASLARASVMRPALLRTNERAVTLEDHEVLAVSKFTTADGRSPFARAHAVQEGAGPRSVKLWLVGPESAVPAPGDLDEADRDPAGGRRRVLQHHHGSGRVRPPGARHHHHHRGPARLRSRRQGRSRGGAPGRHPASVGGVRRVAVVARPDVLVGGDERHPDDRGHGLLRLPVLRGQRRGVAVPGPGGRRASDRGVRHRHGRQEVG